MINFMISTSQFFFLLLLLLCVVTVDNRNTCPEIPGCQCAPNHRVRCKPSNPTLARYFHCRDSWQFLMVVADSQEIFDGMDFSRCSNLTHLTIQSSNIQQLRPNKFVKLYKLKTFTINNCNLKQIESGALKGFTSLNRIAIRDNGMLQSLPTDLFHNFIVKEVIISGNAIEYVDSSLFSQELLNWNLKKLDLSHNRIVTVNSNAFIKLAELSHLDLSYNQLEFLPPATIPPISFLKLSDNKIKTLTTLTELTDSLKSLDIENNLIGSLTALPSLLQLTTLNLANNVLTVFPPSSQWENFPLLEILHIQGHLFSCAPSDSLPSRVKLINFKRCDKGPREPRNQNKNSAGPPSSPTEEAGEDGRQFRIIIGSVAACLGVALLLLIGFVVYSRRPARHKGRFDVNDNNNCEVQDPLTSRMDSVTFPTPVREGSIFRSEMSSRPPASNMESLIDSIVDSDLKFEVLGPESEQL